MRGRRSSPAAVPLAEPGPRQLRVIAHYADGHQRDVTRLASYQASMTTAAASVNPQGQVTPAAPGRDRPDRSLSVARREHAALDGHQPRTCAFDFSKLKRRNFIDDELFKRLESLKVPPSPPASDAAFLRRVSLDLTGEQPSPDEVRRFLADTRPGQARQADRPAARKSTSSSGSGGSSWATCSRSARPGRVTGPIATRPGSIGCLNKNRPWDEVVRTLLTAVGDPNDIETGGPVNYAMDAIEPNVQAELTAQRFLGLRIRCAQCHDHPFDVWTQDAYYGLASFFAKVQRGGGGPGAMMGRATITINPEGQVVHLRTKKPVEPRLLDGKPVKVAAEGRPAQGAGRLDDAAGQPLFRAGHGQLGLGPALRQGTGRSARRHEPGQSAGPPRIARRPGASISSPAKFDLRDLIRTIAASETYGLSSATGAGQRARHPALFAPTAPAPDGPPDGRRAGPGDRRAQSFPGRGRRARAIDVPDPDRRPARSSTRSAAARGPTILRVDPRAGSVPSPGAALDRRRRDRKQGRRA